MGAADPGNPEGSYDNFAADSTLDRKAHVLNERAAAREALSRIDDGGEIERKVARVFELVQSLKNKGASADALASRDLLRSATSNLQLSQKTLLVSWLSPFDVIAGRAIFDCGAPCRDGCRTTVPCHGLSQDKAHGLFCKVLSAAKLS